RTPAGEGEGNRGSQVSDPEGTRAATAHEASLEALGRGERTNAEARLVRVRRELALEHRVVRVVQARVRGRVKSVNATLATQLVSEADEADNEVLVRPGVAGLPQVDDAVLELAGRLDALLGGVLDEGRPIILVQHQAADVGATQERGVRVVVTHRGRVRVHSRRGGRC